MKIIDWETLQDMDQSVLVMAFSLCKKMKKKNRQKSTTSKYTNIRH